MNPAVTANIPKLDMLCAVFIASPIIFSSFLCRSTHFGEILAHCLQILESTYLYYLCHCSKLTGLYYYSLFATH